MPHLIRLLKFEPSIAQEKLVFFPVSIFWSRAPEKDEKSFLIPSFFPDNTERNWFQKLLLLILHRGEINISFGKQFPGKFPKFPNHLEDTLSKISWEREYAKRMRRLFHIEFAKERTAAFGPTLYQRSKIIRWIVSSDSIQKLIATSSNPSKIKKQIVQYIKEISANYTYVTIRALEKIFDFVWNKVFDGVQVKHFNSIERIAKDSQIVWMPSHRSHFDYLLLSYVLFKKGLVVPHVAAGINLNFWPIGSILRKGGAFFIRRSFSGNKAYTQTFSEYVNFLMQNSYPIEFFQEGGRSRYGKLLVPKTGMLSICVQSIIGRKAENTYFIPVYFGYDKVMEDDTYAKELRGAKKQTENALQFLNGVRKVFTNYGSVNVSFGEPVQIGHIWKEYCEKVEKECLALQIESHLPYFSDLMVESQNQEGHLHSFVKYLAHRINEKINGAAMASASSIVSTALIACSQIQLQEKEFQYMLVLLHWIVNQLGEKLRWRISSSYHHENDLLPYLLNSENKEFFFSSNVQKLWEHYIKIGLKWNLFQKGSFQENDQIFMNPQKEMNLWWYRGTVFHLYAVVSLVAHIFLLLFLQSQGEVSKRKVLPYFDLVRSLWQDELFWDKQSSNEDFFHASVEILVELGYLKQNETHFTMTDDKTKTIRFQFLANLTKPERDLYLVQLLSALEITKIKDGFIKEDLFFKAHKDHSVAMDSLNISIPPIFSKIFAQRVFDAFSKIGVFYSHENLKFRLNMDSVSKLLFLFHPGLPSC